jgi:lon-related putative ATP-dependent protease
MIESSQEIQAQIASAMRDLHKIETQSTERITALDREIASFVTGPMIDALREEFSLNQEVLRYLDQVQDDLPEHLHDFWQGSSAQSTSTAAAEKLDQQVREEHLARYKVNVLVDNSQTRGAPVVFDRNPTYYNLIGRIDYRATMAAMVTDFQQIKPGALHRANGGFLLLHADDLLRNPYAWEALKRSLDCHEIQIENFGEQLTPIPTARLRPEPVPLDVKVIVIGPQSIYQLLLSIDEDFQQFFKVKADFAPDMPWSQEHILNYAAFISREVRESKLRHFDRGAVARVVEYGARLREDQRKLSTRLMDVGNVVVEASYWATKAGHDPVMASDVETAIHKRINRSNLIEERLEEMIEDDTIMIDVQGRRVGQVNGLSVIDIGDYSFGKPSRISARVALGRGTVTSVEREIEMSGPIHSKGVLILTGYLNGTYGDQAPLAITATITFEQAYEGVEGDSASSTELYALLSVLSGLPIEQGIAVTGSVNQYGEIQAVGGVTRKVEGFFDVCKAKGLTGRQGVIVPASNVKNLMLHQDVIEAVEDEKFSLWAVRSIDEGIEILTGVPAGTRDADGRYPEGTVHRLVADRLRDLAERVREFGFGLNGQGRGDGATVQRPENPGNESR